MSINVLVGELLSGRITATIPVTSLSWVDVLNGSGSMRCTVPADAVRDHDLRQKTHGVRSFLAVEVDGRIKQAGPIWARTWNWEDQELTLAAAGVWSWLDHRVILPQGAGEPINKNVFTVTDKSLGGIGRAIVERAINTPVGGDVPILLPPDEAGDRTESFPLWSVPWAGEQLRQITQRATDAPDIAFPARRTSADARNLEWVMLVGTEAQPSLTQGGPDWVIDASSPKSSVHGITTDEDATQMAQQVFLTGNGFEEDTLMSAKNQLDLINLQWPITEASESRSTVEDQTTLDEHASAFLERRNRPIEVFKVTVTAASAAEVTPGDHVRLITKGDLWLGDMDRTMRVKQISGDLSDRVTLEMFPLEAAL